MAGKANVAMMNLFDTSDFPARWHCGRWSELLGWTHIVADIIIFAAYVAIPSIIIFFMLRRRDVVFSHVAFLFAAFILLCGTGHLLEAVVFWAPIYRFTGLLKVATALVSIATVLVMIRITPRALALPGLAALNDQLATENTKRTEAEHLFRTLIEAAPNAFLAVDDRGKIVLVNQLAETLFGYSRHEFLGMSVDELVPRDVQETHAQFRDEFLSAPTKRPMGSGRDLFARRKDGSTFPVAIGLTPIQNQARTLVLSSVVDITERVAGERRLQEKADELARSNANLEEFAYVASHDLREPLRKVNAFGERLESGARESLSPKHLEYLGRMRNAVGRMEKLIESLLAYCRISPPRDRAEGVDLNQVLRGVVSDLDFPISESRGEVVIENLPVVQGDPDALRQVFQNLVSNAIKFRRPETAPLVRIQTAPCDDESTLARITVSDNGIGIDHIHCDRVFKLFQRLHGRHEYEGAGIGLSIAKKIVEHHGGKLELTKSLMDGATFSITLKKRKYHPSIRDDTLKPSTPCAR